MLSIPICAVFYADQRVYSHLRLKTWTCGCLVCLYIVYLASQGIKMLLAPVM